MRVHLSFRTNSKILQNYTSNLLGKRVSITIPMDYNNVINADLFKYYGRLGFDYDKIPIESYMNWFVLRWS